MEPRNRIAVNPLTTGKWTLAQDLALHEQLGLGRISLSQTKVAAAGGLTRAAGMVAAAGVDVVVLYPAGGMDLADPGSWPDARRRAEDALELAAGLGCPSVLVTGGSARGLLWEEAAARFAEAIGPVAQRGHSLGVRLLLEAVRPQFAYAGFVHSLRDAIALAGPAGLGVAVDVTHCWWEPGLEALVADHVDLVGTVHMADLRLDRPVTTRVVPGDGHLPLDRLVGMLAAADYQGPFEVEVIGPELDQEGIAAGVARAVAATEQLLAGA